VERLLPELPKAREFLLGRLVGHGRSLTAGRC
jgi:hypothetical protein